jgi:hypothetical protein
MDILSRIAILVFKVVFIVPFLLYCTLIKGDLKDLNDWLHETHFDSIMDFFSGSFFSFITYSKLMNSGVNIHGIFEAIFFYFGGVASLVWVLFRIKLAILDHKIKTHTLKEKKEANNGTKID